MNSEQNGGNDPFIVTDKYEGNKQMAFTKVWNGVERHVHFREEYCVNEMRVGVKLFLNVANIRY